MIKIMRKLRMGFKPMTSESLANPWPPNLWPLFYESLGFICNCLSYFTTAKISFTSISITPRLQVGSLFKNLSGPSLLYSSREWVCVIKKDDAHGHLQRMLVRNSPSSKYILHSKGGQAIFTWQEHAWSCNVNRNLSLNWKANGNCSSSCQVHSRNCRNTGEVSLASDCRKPHLQNV